MDKQYISFNDNLYYFLDLELVLIDTIPYLSVDIDLHIIINNLKDFYSEKETFTIVKEIENIGYYEDLNSYYSSDISLNIIKEKETINVKSFYSYSCFYSTLYNPPAIIHVYDSKYIFKLKQEIVKSEPFYLKENKVICNNISQIGFYLFDIQASSIMGNNITQSIKSPSNKIYNSFNFKEIFYIEECSFMFNLVAWDFKPIIAGSLSLTRIINNKFKIDTFIHSTISLYEGYIDFEDKVYPFLKLGLQQNLDAYYSYFQKLNVSIDYTLNGVVSEKLVFNDMLVLNEIYSSNIIIVPVVTKAYDYKIVDISPVYFDIFNVSNHTGTYTNLEGVLLEFCTMNSIISLCDYTSNFVKYKVTSTIDRKDLEGITLYLNELLILSSKFLTDVSYEKNNVFTIKIYEHSFKKENLFRQILFNKRPKKISKHAFFGKFQRIKDLHLNTTSIIFDNIVTINGKFLTDTSYKNIFNVKSYKNVTSTPVSTEISLIPTGKHIVYQYVDIFMYIDGTLKGKITNKNNGFSYNIAILAYTLNVFLKPKYKRAAFILKTQLDKTYEWSEKTIEKAKETILEAKNETEICQKLGIYPYGIRDILNFSGSYYRNYYIPNGTNMFLYEGMVFYVENYPIERQNVELDIYKDIKIVGINNTVFKVLSSYKRIANTITNTTYEFVDLINTPKKDYYLKASGILKNKHIIYKNSNFVNYKNKLYLTNKKTINTNSFVCAFVGLLPKINTKDIQSDIFSININGITVNNVLSDNLYLSIEINPFLNEVLSPNQYIHINTPTTLNNISLDVCNFEFIKVKNSFNYIDSVIFNIKIAELINLQGIINKYNTVWMQIFYPMQADIANISINLIDIQPVNEQFTIDMPITYSYVDDLQGKIEGPRPNKQTISLPSIMTLYEEGILDIPTKTKIKTEQHFCQDAFNGFSLDGFSFNIERDNKLLVGNNTYRQVKNIYGALIEEKQSIFIGDRKLSDISLFTKQVSEEILNDVNFDNIQEFSEKDLLFTSEDMEVDNEELAKINRELQELEKQSSQQIVAEDNEHTKKILSDPKIKEEIDRYIDDLGDPYDSVKFPDVETRPYIDGKLLKKIRVEQTLVIKERK